MSDYWNDPPDQPDPPGCPNDKPPCDGLGEYLYAGKTGHVFSCDTCGYQWVVPYPAEPEPEEEVHEQVEEVHPPTPKTCAHGKPCGECVHCDFLADIAFDTWRESRWK